MWRRSLSSVLKGFRWDWKSRYYTISPMIPKEMEVKVGPFYGLAFLVHGSLVKSLITGLVKSRRWALMLVTFLQEGKLAEEEIEELKCIIDG